MTLLAALPTPNLSARPALVRYRCGTRPPAQLLLRAACLLVLGLLLASCATDRVQSGRTPLRSGYVKDNKPSIWVSDHPLVRRFREKYASNSTVETGLLSGRRYLPAITREFRRRGLPLELAYLPILESMFENNADSGHAKGLWQFTPQTAEHMGLRVGAFADERLNWQKATVAAAQYLDDLGAQFNYNWALALAAYNGGPNYMEQNMRSQGSSNFFDLRLRQETAEYVPRFIAIMQVAKERYPHLLIAAR